MVRMKNLLNNNVWLWDRGKFLNRRFLMQVKQCYRFIISISDLDLKFLMWLELRKAPRVRLRYKILAFIYMSFDRGS